MTRTMDKKGIENITNHAEVTFLDDSVDDALGAKTAALCIAPLQQLKTRKINTFPDELLIFIFSNLLTNDAVCLGLASRNLYRVLKIFRPAPIQLDDGFTAVQISGRSFQTDPLRVRLAGFIGPQYRISRDGSRYLRREVYGEGYSWGGAEGRLCQRYRDYDITGLAYSPGRTMIWVGEPFFPCPYNMGSEWDVIAANLVQAIDFAARKTEWRSNFEDNLCLIKETRVWSCLGKAAHEELQDRESRWRAAVNHSGL